MQGKGRLSMDKENVVGKNIRMYREGHDLFQEELANKLGVTPKAVSAWETGKTEPRMGAILKMCNIFNCSVKDLTEKNEWKGTPVTAKVDYSLKVENTETMIEMSKPNYENERVLRIYNSLMPDQQERVIDYMVRMLTGKE